MDRRDPFSALDLPDRRALGDDIAEAIRSAILRGEIRPGQPIPENTLAQRLGVSRSPVREALARLEREGLVVSRLGRRTTVRTFSRREIEELYTIRAALDGIAARWAASNPTPESLATLAERAARLREAIGDAAASPSPETIPADVGFHRAVAAASGSEELRKIVDGLSYQVHLIMVGGFATLTPRRAEEMHAEHEALLAAIRRRDADAAERIAREHAVGAQRRLIHAAAAAEQVG